MNEINIKFAEFLRPAFFNSDKYSVIAAGRQTGKTYNAIIWLVISLLQSKNKRGLWVDTVHNNLDKYVERYFATIFKDIWHLCHYSKIDKTIKLPNKSYIDLRSAERPENMQGFAYDYVVLNEAGIILKNDKLWYNAILPMTQNAQVKIIGTPKGKNLFFQLYHKQDEGWKNYKYSVYDSPYWSDDTIETIKQQVPLAVFQQEFLAEFLENESIVFKNIQACQHDYNLPIEPVNNDRYYMGVDLAKFSDFSVISIINQDCKQVYFERFNQIDYTIQKTKIVEVAKKYKASVLIDSTGVGSAIFDDLKKVLSDKLAGYQFTNQTKKELIEDLILAFETQKITIPKNNEVQNSELITYEYTINRSGLISYNAPDGFHDDTVIALALAYQLAKSEPVAISLSFI